LKETEATSLLANQSEQGVAALQFTKVKDYTTFDAEHASDGSDLIFHFFRTEENSSDNYWKEIFPNALSEVAQAVFQAGYPRLRATYTREVDSWWLRADGFADEGLPEERILHFYKKLDQALDTMNKSAPRT